MNKTLVPLLIIPFIAACGSSDSSDSKSSSVKTGYFIDSAVANIQYSTSSQSGRTTTDGEFKYKEGETVTFSIGDIELPATTSKPQITPLDLVTNGTLESTEVVNIARLLQTLDSDGNPNNGITIADSVHDAAASIDIDLEDEDFENDATLINFIADAVSESATLVSVEDAKAHLNDTLEGLKLIIDVELKLENSEETFTWGDIRVTQSERFEESDSTVTLNITYPSDFELESDVVVTLTSDGNGSILFPEDDDANDFDWEINENGQIEATETDEYDDEWTYVITLIEPTSDGENLLIELDSPAGQDDYSRGAFLATINEE